MFKFWSLGRSGLHCFKQRRATMRQLCAAFNVCGVPRPVFCLTRMGAPSNAKAVAIGLDFYSGKLFRCSFTLYITKQGVV